MSNDLSHTNQRLDRLEAKIDNLQEEASKGFRAIVETLVIIRDCLNGMAERFNDMDKRFDGQDNQLVAINKKLDAKFEAVIEIANHIKKDVFDLNAELSKKNSK